MAAAKKYPVLVKEGRDDVTPESMGEFNQLRYDGWAMKNPDAEIPVPEPVDESEKQNDSTPPTPPASEQKTSK